MTRYRVLAAVAVAFGLPGSRLLPAQNRDAPPASAAAPLADSVAAFTGDWGFTIQFRDSTIGGGWRINHADGRFTGIVSRPGVPPSPIRSFSVRNGRDMTLSVEWKGEPYTFTGHLENPRNITGSVSYRGGTGQFRAQKRG
jgi:hypothetical protein